MRIASGLLAVLGVMLGGVVVFLSAGEAIAAPGIAEDWQLGFQDAVTPVMQEIEKFHNFVLILVTIITVFVMMLLLIVMVRFNAKRNPTPSRTTHNTMIEVVWTIAPILILLVIAIPSFRLLYLQRDLPEIDFTIKATGHQWHWRYEYPDHQVGEFESYMVDEADLEEGQPRLLTVDQDIVVPVNATVRVIVTAEDVLHNWAMPSFGVKMDAVPGRLNETWFRAVQTGIFHGQCSELCGINHAFMPITVRVVSESEFETWIAGMQDEYPPLEASLPPSGTFADASHQ